MKEVSNRGGWDDRDDSMEAHEEAELRFWAEKCGVSPDELDRVMRERTLAGHGLQQPTHRPRG